MNLPARVIQEIEREIAREFQRRGVKPTKDMAERAKTLALRFYTKEPR